MIADLGLPLSTTRARVYPSEADRVVAAALLKNLPAPIVALHPGSGSEKKNWPLPNWKALGEGLLDSADFSGSILVVTGEADDRQAVDLQYTWTNPRVRFASNLPLTHLAAALEQAIFIGHDSGISHLAAAAGAKCLLLFGPTDPEVWAPTGDDVKSSAQPSI